MHSGSSGNKCCRVGRRGSSGKEDVVAALGEGGGLDSGFEELLQSKKAVEMIVKLLSYIVELTSTSAECEGQESMYLEDKMWREHTPCAGSIVRARPIRGSVLASLFSAQRPARSIPYR